MILGIPMCDWITLTTKDGDLFVSIRLAWQSERQTYHGWKTRAMRKSSGKGLSRMKINKSKVLQYDGQTIDGVFFGYAKQGGEDSYMIRVSGETANSFVGSYPVVASMNCTRVDFQVTDTCPQGFAAMGLRNELKTAEWRGRVPKMTAYVSDGGMDTLYLGSRSSERMLRVYVKMDEDGMRYLRYELELKGAQARGAMELMESMGWGYTVASVLADSYGRLPIDRDGSWLSVFSYLDDMEAESPSRAVIVREKNSTITWLFGTVLSALEKVASNHETRSRAVEFVAAAQALVDKGEVTDV